MHVPHQCSKFAEMGYSARRLRTFFAEGMWEMSTPDPISKTHRDLTEIPDSSALPVDLVRALSWLRGHLSEPIQLELLAQVSGVRPRTLEMHFKMFLGTTPLGWVRRMRFTRARRELLRAGPQTTVTDVAIAVGFSQLGRFAVEYRKIFGEVPSTTIQRARSSSRKGTDPNIDEAIRLTMSALPFAFAVAPKQCNAALEELGRPQELAPTYGLPKAMAAWCWGQRAAHRFSSTPDIDRERAYRLAEEAYDLAPDDALTLTLSSGALVLLHRLEEADRRLERALALDPWLAYAWVRRGWMSAYLGDGEGAIRELRTALHLMPFEPLRHISFIGMGCAHFVAERYDRAGAVGTKRCGGLSRVLLGGKNCGSRSRSDGRTSGSPPDEPRADAEGPRSDNRGGSTGLALYSSLHVAPRRRP